jgi:integrase
MNYIHHRENPNRTILTIEEFRRIKHSGFSESAGSRSAESPAARLQNAVMFELLFTTGMRLGEAASLTVSQVLNVEIDEGQDVGLLYLRRDKWGRRPLPVGIDRRILDVLREHIAKGRAELGGAPDSGALWLNRQGRPADPSHWTPAFQRAAVRSIPPGRSAGVGPHTLRRSWTVHICQLMSGTPGSLDETIAHYAAFVLADEIHKIGRFAGPSDLLRRAIHQLAVACQ